MWPRNRMRRDRSGLLACPDDMTGRDAVTLDAGNARGALRGRKSLAGDTGAIFTETFEGQEYLMVPIAASTVRNPHTNEYVPLAGEVATADAQWLWLRTQNLISFQAAP